MKYSMLTKALSCTLLISSSALTFAADYNFTMATTTPANSPWGSTLTSFQNLVKEYTKGQVEINASFGGALGNDTQLLQKTQLGSTVQGAQSSGANLGSVVSAFKAFDVPYIINSLETSTKLFYPNGSLGGETVDELQSLMAKKNLRLLYVMPFEFRGILTTEKTINSPADMEGLKIRVTPSEVERSMITELGSGATTLGISEVYTALQTGTVDGLAIPPITAVAFGLHEVANNINLLNFQPHGSFMTVNARAWSKLPKDIQAKVQQAADKAVQENIQVFESELTTALAKFKEQGVKVIQPSQQVQDEFAAIIQAPAAKIATQNFNSDEKHFFKTLQTALDKI
ncbi:TRAP transporter substrate-binding protein [Marinomonas dokdonensis]|uniref:TRAP transporter substrate-binding protein n=1 Tax=Marinomonas dokdonensis TaxID=328224 RepID=UPI00405586DC